MPHSSLLHYQHQHSTQTLQQGLDEYFAAHPSLLRSGDLSAEAQLFFRCHDTVHVLYGCSTSLPDEAVVKIASLRGTTEGLAVLKGYALHESRAIYGQLHATDVLRNLGATLWAVPRTWWRCSRQTMRWPWTSPPEYLDMPLVALRARYGIRVSHVDSAADD